MSVGYGKACAVRESGEVTCWGSTTPEKYIPAGPHRSVSAAVIHTCALRESGAIACWGLAGQLKDFAGIADFPIEEDYGQAEPPAGTYRAVSAAATHTCAIRESGEIDCWGLLTNAPAGKYRSLSAARGYTCAVRESGEIDCWGGAADQSGAPRGTYRAVSVSGSAPLGLLGPSVSGHHACGLRESGEIDCWLGHADQTDVPAGTYRAVSAGFGHICAIRESGEIVCWDPAPDPVPRGIR